MDRRILGKSLKQLNMFNSFSLIAVEFGPKVKRFFIADHLHFLDFLLPSGHKGAMGRQLEDQQEMGNWRDRVGITVSVLCMFHCLLTPLVLLGVPYLAHQGGEALLSDLWHQAFLILVPVVAIFAFWPGWKMHHDRRVWWLSAWGLFFLVAGVTVGLLGGGHSHIAGSQGEVWLSLDHAGLHEFPAYTEIVLTMIGSVLFIRAHLLNRKLVGCARPHSGAGCNHRHPRLELAPKIG